MPHDAVEVLKIMLPRSMCADFVAWHYEKSSNFTVCSAYKLALNEKLAISSSNSFSKNGERTLWDNIWKANVPSKVRFSLGS